MNGPGWQNRTDGISSVAKTWKAVVPVRVGDGSWFVEVANFVVVEIEIDGDVANARFTRLRNSIAIEIVKDPTAEGSVLKLASCVDGNETKVAVGDRTAGRQVDIPRTLRLGKGRNQRESSRNLSGYDIFHLSIEVLERIATIRCCGDGRLGRFSTSVPIQIEVDNDATKKGFARIVDTVRNRIGECRSADLTGIRHHTKINAGHNLSSV